MFFKAQVMETAKSLGNLRGSGGGWVTPSQVAFWSGVSKSTTYRVLNFCVLEGLLETQDYVKRGIDCKRYRLTELGHEQFKFKLSMVGGVK